MRFFRRRTSTLPEEDRRAVPLTPRDVEVLVTAYTEDDRLTRIHRPDVSGGAAYSRNKAASVMRAAGLAASLGHDTVPFPIADMSMLECVQASLQQWAPRAASTRAFGLLILKLEALSAQARRHRWFYDWDTDGWTWIWLTPEQPQLPAGPTH